MKEQTAIVPFERIATVIHLFRGQKVMLDRDLAKLYGPDKNIKTGREKERQPLSRQEVANLRSQFVTSSSWGGLRYPPMAFIAQSVHSSP